MKIFLLIIAVSYLAPSSAYVLLQVRRGGNQSNVDALIHKVVPSGVAHAAHTARKQFDQHKHSPNRVAPKQPKIAYGNSSNRGLESIVVAIDGGVGSEARARPDAAGRAVRRLAALLEDGALNLLPKYRAELEKYHIKPEIVHFRSGKPSVMFEVDTRAVLRSLQRALASRQLQQTAERVAARAAALYRSVRDELLRE